MKKIIVTVAAVALLAVSCNNNGQGGGSARTGTDSTVVAEVSSQISYIRLDVLMENYEMVAELSEALEEKASKAETELTSKGRSLERAFADYQEKIEKGLVTRAQAAELQERLQRQEQSFYQHREQVTQELAEENEVMMNNIYHNLTTFIEEFNSDHRYGVILTTSGVTPILSADPRLDITQIVVDGLNERYAREKKSGTAE